MSRIARPTTTSLTAPSIDIIRLCHAPTLASTRRSRHAPSVLAAERKASPFLLFVATTFLFGWLVGLAIVLKIWDLANAPRWMLFSGAGYVSLMLGPTMVGFGFARALGPLTARGWSGASLGLLCAGVVGLVAGLLAL